MSEEQNKLRQEVTALKIHQWLDIWDRIPFKENEYRSRPEPYFYIFSLSAADLKLLSGIYRRTRTTTNSLTLQAKDLGIQRRHDEKRSEEIRKFIRYGFPLSSSKNIDEYSEQFESLQKPGWLPTAIVVNILKPNDVRRGKKVAEQDLLVIEQQNEKHVTSIKLPKRVEELNWQPQALHPIEVIDGQHRLWAFNENDLQGQFELPVVAFYGLDVSWQAYLFWIINIRPKRINPSLAFDLYPLLRLEDWLERSADEHFIYREARAQELVEALWAYPESPWYGRINMLGETGNDRTVTQAAWIKALTSTFIKSGRAAKPGGLFSSPVESLNNQQLTWSRVQQAAFLIFAWQKIRNAVVECHAVWAEHLRVINRESKNLQQLVLIEENVEELKEPAFDGPYTHLNTNIGTRGVLFIINDLCYVLAEKLKLEGWFISDFNNGEDEVLKDMDGNAIEFALASLESHEAGKFLDKLANSLATYDWRIASTPNSKDQKEIGLKDEEILSKAAIRGGPGYKEIRKQLLNHLAREEGEIGQSADAVIKIIGV